MGIIYRYFFNGIGKWEYYRLHWAIDYNTPDEIYYKGVNNKSYELVKSILGVG